MSRRLPALALSLLLGAGAAVQAPAPAPGGRSHDTQQPIEITADNLEVRQEQQVAIFSGNVDAVQGAIRLKADTLRVHYRQNEPARPSAAGRTASAGRAAAAPNAPDMAAKISRIDAVGKVFVSSPEETARGERGFYDVERQIIVLEGSVVLTQGQNVLRGNRATLNLATGRSEMEAAPGGRVRGLFVPQQQDERR